jgi:hypothetical protein
MRGVSTNSWRLGTRLEVEQWLEDMYGPATLDTWFVDQDYFTTGIAMNEEIFLVYQLKWGHL